MRPRRRRARREAEAEAVAAAAAKSARETSHVSIRTKDDLARHRRREKQSGGEGNAAFSTPFSTPRRGQPAAAPPHQTFSSWRGRQRGRDIVDLDRNGGGDSPVLDYPVLPPSVLPDARRRRGRDLSNAVATGGTGRAMDDDFGGRRRGGRRSRKVVVAQNLLIKSDCCMLYRLHQFRCNTRHQTPHDQMLVFFSMAQEAELEYNRGRGEGGGGGARERKSLGRGTTKEYQDQTAPGHRGARRDNARGNHGPASTRGLDQHPPYRKHSSSGHHNNEFAPNQQHPQARRGRQRGEGGGRSAGVTSRLEAQDAPAAAAPSTSRSPGSEKSRSPSNNQISLGKMSGFGPGDRGWSERVEKRRQQQLAQRNRAVASTVAEVDNDSGKIQPILTPTAPAASFDGHQQAMSPPRLRRLVRAEV